MQLGETTYSTSIRMNAENTAGLDGETALSSPVFLDIFLCN